MARSQKEATIIVLDIGENTLVASGKSSVSFFERAKKCASKIIQKKIFSKPNDEIGLILMGSDETENDLNQSLEGFNNIVEKIPLQMPTWDMVRTLESLDICDFSSDWVDGLVVALNFANSQAKAKKFTNIRILLITNFITSTSDSNIDVIVKSILDTNIEVVAISDCIEHSDQLKSSHFTQNSQNATQTQSQRLYMDVIKQVGGFLCHIDQAEAQLLIFQKKAKKPWPWNVQLTIGSKLNIEVSAYVAIEEEKFLSSFKTECIQENTVTKLVTEYTQNNREVEKPNAENVINAYFYGSTLVPLADDSLNIVTDKGLTCIGFTKRELVLDEYRVGDNCHVVLPRKDSKKSATMLAGLVDVLKQGNYVMIARKVYNKGNKPSVVVLIPEVENEVRYFTMIQLAFGNDINVFSFPELRKKRTEPTKEQKQVVQEFVAAMDLMEAGDGGDGITEAFALETSLNPVNQHLCRAVAFRALNPNQPLPKIDQELVAMLDVPKQLKKANEKIMKELEELFPLENVETKKKRKVFGHQRKDEIAASEDGEEEDEEKKVIGVGTVTPAEDFAYLLKKGGRFTDLSAQLKTIIYDFMFRTASVQTEKVLLSILMYREQSKIFMPFDYNQWIREIKQTVVKRNRTDLWRDIVVKESLGLINVHESPISTVTMKEQKDFYEIADMPVQQTGAMNVDEDDLEDLA